MEYFLLALAITYVAGLWLGALYRKSVIRKLRRTFDDKPEYSLLHAVSPLEYELLISGKTSINGLLGELAAMSNAGVLLLDPESQSAYIEKKRGSGSKLQNEIANMYINQFGNEYGQAVVGFGQLKLSKRALRRITTRSLRSKGWRLNNMSSTGIFDSASPTFMLQVFGTFMLACVGTALILATHENTNILTLIGALAFFSPLIWVAYVFGINFRKAFRNNSLSASRVWQHHATEWADLYGIAHYLEVSGADVFTPDYARLTFDDLDPLYPYWVALGFDGTLKQILG